MNSLNASAVASEGQQAFSNPAAPRKTWPALNLAEVRGKLWAAKFRIFAIACFCALTAAVYAVLNPPSYEASARILIDLRSGQEATGGVNASGTADELSSLESQIQVITSDGVLRRVVQAEKLALDPEFGVRVSLLAGTVSASPTNKGNPEQRALEQLASALRVSRVPGSFVVDVTVASRSPLKSARIAQAVAETYVRTEREAKASEAGKAASSFSRQLDELRADLKAAEDKVEKYKADNQLVDAAGRLISDQQLSQLSAELIAARAKAAESRTKYEQIERFQRSGTSLDTLADAIQSEIITQLRVRLASLRAQMVAREAILHPDNPELKQMRDQAASLGRQINVELERIASSAKSEAVRMQTNVLDLERELQKRSGDSVKVKKSLSGLRALERVAEAKKTVYEAFLAKTRNLGEQGPARRDTIRIVSPASAPGSPTGLPLPAMVIFGFAGGLLAASAYALARSPKAEPPLAPAYQQPQPQPAAQPGTPFAPAAVVERMQAYGHTPFPQAPPASALPAVAPAAHGAPMPVQTSSPAAAWPAASDIHLPLLGTISDLSDPTGLYPFVISEPISLASAAIGQLNRNLSTTRRRGVAQTVLVGSCGPVEARPGIAMNLALFAAAGGDRVLLIDADFADRDLSATLASTAVLGLGEIARGIVAPGDVMIKHPNLTVAFVPAAESRHEPPVTVSEQALREHVLGAVSGFDLIVFDGGRLLERPSTPALAAIAHDIVVVTDQRDPARSALEPTLDALGLNRSKVRGTLSVA